MDNLYNRTLNQRGGVPLRDYRQSGFSLSPISRVRRNGLGDTLSRINFNTLGHSLVLASLGLGLFELFFPKAVQKLTGVHKAKHDGLVRLLGLREISSGVLTYAQDPPHLGIWSRVLGDVMDLGLLGRVLTLPKSRMGRTAGATAFIAAITAVDVLTALRLRKMQMKQKKVSSLTQEDMSGARRGQAFRVVKSITIDRPAEELYRFWRDFENLPQFMYHLQDVRVLNNQRSHWVTKAPAGQVVEWDAIITEDRPNELIRWETSPGAQIPNAGVVHFTPAPGGRGTVVKVELEYDPLGGAIGRIFSMLFGEEPGQQIGDDLRRFKNVMEVGEVVRSDGNLQGTGQKGQRMAQPLPEETYNQMRQDQFEPQGEQESMEWQKG